MVGPADCGKTSVARMVLKMMGDGGNGRPPRLMTNGITEAAVIQLALVHGALLVLNDLRMPAAVSFDDLAAFL